MKKDSIKYNININQKALSELKTHLDITDAAILDYIYVLCSSVNEKIDEKRIKDETGIWTWVDFTTLIAQMPLLGIKTRSSITPRIKKIEREGFIKTYKKRIGGHVRLFLKLEAKVDLLFVQKESLFVETNGDESLFVSTNDPVRTDEQEPVRLNEPIIILETNNKIRTIGKLDQFEQFWLEYPSKKGLKPTREKWLAKITPELGETIISDVKKRKEKDRQWLEGFIPHPTTYLNQERWQDEITPARKTQTLSADTPYVAGKYENPGKKQINVKI